MTTFVLVTIVAAISGSLAYRGIRRYWFDEGIVQGYKQGILDAAPWTCDQGHANRGTTLMCCKCGVDRFYDSDMLRNVLGNEHAR